MEKIINAVIDCCKSSMCNDTMITKDNLLGRSRRENICIARAILVSILIKEGYTVSTISSLLNRTTQGIRHIIKMDYYLKKHSKCYNIMANEAIKHLVN